MRTIKEIVEDFCTYLYEKDPELTEFKKPSEIVEDEKERSFYLGILMEKLYEENGFYFFTTFVIGKDIDTDTKIWNNVVAFFDWLMKQHKYLNILAPRGVGKSFIFSILYPIYYSFLFSNLEILIVNNTNTQAGINFEKLKKIILDNELLLLKKEKDAKWKEDMIEYNKSKIYIRSLGSMTRGLHVDLLIIDDILRQDSRYSFKYIREYVLQSLFPTTERKKARIILISTPQSELDIHHRLAEVKEGSSKFAWSEPFENPFIPTSLVRAGKSHTGFFNVKMRARDEKKTVTISNAYSLEDLERLEAAMGSLNFQKEYLCEVISDRTALFPPSLIKKALAYDESAHFQGIPGCKYVIGVDVASSGAASADYSAFTVRQIIGEDEYGNMKGIIRNVVRVKGMPISEQIEKIAEMYKEYNQAGVIVEKNNVGVALIQELQKRGIPVVIFTTNKPKKEGAVRYLITQLANGNLKIAYDETAKDIIDPLIEELQNFGIKIKMRDGKRYESMEALSGHDDIIDSLWLNLMYDHSKLSAEEVFALVQD